MPARARKLSLITALVAVAACTGSDGAADAAADGMQNSAIEGAWRLAELKVGDAAPIANPPGVYVFTSGHYAITYSNIAGPRPTFADPIAPTDAERLQAYNSLIANSGTYSVGGDTLTIRPIIARNPNYMGGGEDKFVMRTAGDTLWLNSVVGAFRWADGQAAAFGTSDVHTLIRAR